MVYHDLGVREKEGFEKVWKKLASHQRGEWALIPRETTATLEWENLYIRERICNNYHTSNEYVNELEEFLSVYRLGKIYLQLPTVSSNYSNQKPFFFKQKTARRMHKIWVQNLERYT